MNAFEFMQLGDKYFREGNLNMAGAMFTEAKKFPETSGPACLNISEVLRSQGNLSGALDSLKQFMNMPLTPITLDLVPKVKADIDDLLKKISPPK